MTASGWLGQRVGEGRRRTRGFALATAVATTVLSSLVLSSGVGASSLTAHALGAGDVYSMAFPGITGPGSTGGPGDIAIETWSFATSRTATVSPDGRQYRPGRNKPGTIIITRKIDKASPSLYNAAITNKVFPKVTLYVTAPGVATGAVGGDSMTLVFFDAIVIGENWSGAADEIPKETVTLSYLKVAVTYTP
jgi:type VI protein secretion system component Hcp